MDAVTCNDLPGYEPLDPCDGEATEERHGYRLCRGCAEAFDVFLGISERVVGE